MGKRAARRAKVKRMPFGRIVYCYEAIHTPEDRRLALVFSGSDNIKLAPIYGGGQFRYRRYVYSSYEAALVYLTEVKLGLRVEPYYRTHLTPYKLEGGYTKKGKRVITKVTVLFRPELTYERFSVRRDEFSNRLFRKQRGPSFSIPKAVADHRLSYNNYVTGDGPLLRSRPAKSSVSLAPLVQHRAKPVRIPKQRTTEQWRTASGRVERKRFASLQRLSNSALARAK